MILVEAEKNTPQKKNRMLSCKPQNMTTEVSSSYRGISDSFIGVLSYSIYFIVFAALTLVLSPLFLVECILRMIGGKFHSEAYSTLWSDDVFKAFVTVLLPLIMFVIFLVCVSLTLIMSPLILLEYLVRRSTKYSYIYKTIWSAL